MRNSYGHMPLLGTLTIAWFIGSCGSAPVKESLGPAATISLANPYDGVPTPIPDLVKKVFGKTEVELNAELLDQKGALVDTCMTKSGFSVEPHERPSSAVQENISTSVFGGQAASFLRALKSATKPLAVDRKSSASNPARQQALSDCYAEARALESPLSTFYTWLSSESKDVGAKIEADQRVLGAGQTFESCMSAIGYGQIDEAALSNQFSDRANRIYESFLDGSLSESKATKGLSILVDEEAAITPAVEVCIHSRRRVEMTVGAEYMEDFLAKNGDIVAEFMSNAKLEYSK